MIFNSYKIRKWKEELEFPLFWKWSEAIVPAEEVEFVRKSRRIRLVENIKLREGRVQSMET